MFNEQLVAWKTNNGGKLPKHIIYFRDGVSESQYSAVRQSEVRCFLRAFDMMKQKDSIVEFPTVTALVVTKRHHTRFYPNGTANIVRGNTKPGRKF